ncbi:MAG: glycosyltransferase family 2 protein [Prevotella sp.]|nr:glycosyltransferase family 2 protein [Prevotella sp.]
MKVSILVPIYGVERYMADCAKSLFSQTYEDIEYIFVDDCTPDHSVDVLNEVLATFPDRRQQVIILHHEQNQGLGAARLTAINAATGDYVMHVDSDDSLPPHAVELLVDKAQQTGSDIVDGGYGLMCHNEIIREEMPFEGTKQGFLKLMLCQNIVLSMIWGRLYRRTLYTENHIYPIPGIDNGEDLGIVPRLYFHASRATVRAVVYHYRDDNATSYTNVAISDKAIRSYLKANAEVFRFYQAHDKRRTYAYALELGYVNVLRDVRRHAIPVSLVDELCPLRLRHPATRLTATVMRSRCPLAVASLLYRCQRKLFELSVRHGC